VLVSLECQADAFAKFPLKQQNLPRSGVIKLPHYGLACTNRKVSATLNNSPQCREAATEQFCQS